MTCFSNYNILKQISITYFINSKTRYQTLFVFITDIQNEKSQIRYLWPSRNWTRTYVPQAIYTFNENVLPVAYSQQSVQPFNMQTTRK